MNRYKDWRERAVEPDELIRRLPRTGHAFLHGAVATPLPLVEALCRRTDFDDLKLYHLHLEDGSSIADPSQEGRLRSVSLFTGADMRKPIAEGRADFMPIFLSDIPHLFRTRTIPLDAALVQLSPPDRHGNCSLGTAVDIARAAVDSASQVFAEINVRMPRTHGHTGVHIDSLTGYIVTDRPVPEHAPAPIGEVEHRIGELIADLVEDGATLQMGVGSIPDAVLSRLGNKHALGVHTETFSDGLIDLIEGGVITNEKKEVHPGRTTSSFLAGTRRLYDFVDDNLEVELHPADRTNDTALIRKNPKVVAINSALSVDLSGQVCADSIGHRIFSGIGGQVDFMRGAALSPGGKPIIALPSTASKGQVSRIVMTLAPGSGVVTTRGHVHWVVTEYGAVNLFGLTLRQRGEALIEIAHPDFRAELRKELAQVRRFPLG